MTTVLDGLTACAGPWRGVNTLQNPATNLADQSPTTATITPMLHGTFIRMDYTWRYADRAQAGSLLLGYEADVDVVTGYWIDTWHMGDKLMVCRGTVENGAFSLRGSYGASTGAEWGWRIVLIPEPGQRLRLTMNNVTPNGQEELAVAADYERA